MCEPSRGYAAPALLRYAQRVERYGLPNLARDFGRTGSRESLIAIDEASTRLEIMEAASRPVFEPLADLPVEEPIDGSVPDRKSVV